MKFPSWKNRSGSLFSVGSQTSVGMTRTENQDSYGVFSTDKGRGTLERLFIVADGMGGHERGSEASSMAVEVVRSTFYGVASGDLEHRLKRAFNTANERIYTHSQRLGEGTSMGTTCTALAVSSDRFWIAHIGDSRAYRIDREGIFQLTADHTYINELLREGVLSEEEAMNDPRRHNLVKAMGIGPSIEPDVFEIPKPASETRILLCSDGLAVVDTNEIAKIVQSREVQAACDELVRRANDQGGPDNVTVVVVGLS